MSEQMRQHEEFKQRRMRIAQAARAYETMPKTQEQPSLEKHVAEAWTLQNDTQAKIKSAYAKLNANSFRPKIVMLVQPQNRITALPYQQPQVLYFTPPVMRPYVVFKQNPTIRQIAREVCWFYDIPLEEILSDRRQAPTVRARHVAFYLCKKMTKRSFPYIGRMMGGRDHTTVLNGVRRITSKLETDERLVDELDILRMRIAEKMKVVDE